MKITTPQEFATRPDPKGSRSHVVDDICKHIEMTLDSGSLIIPRFDWRDDWRDVEILVAAEYYRSAGWGVSVPVPGSYRYGSVAMELNHRMAVPRTEAEPHQDDRNLADLI